MVMYLPRCGSFTVVVLCLLAGAVCLPRSAAAQGCNVVFGREISDATTSETEKSQMRDLSLNLSLDCNTVAVTMPDMTNKLFAPSPSLEQGDVPYYWTGMEESDGSILSFILDENGKVYGSLINGKDGSVSEFLVDANMKPFVRTTRSQDLLPGGEPLLSGNLSDLAMAAQQSHGQGLVSVLGTGGSTHGEGRTLADTGDVLDLLVVWTAHAECRISAESAGCPLTSITTNNMLAFINLAVSNTNNAFTASGVLTRLRLVHAYRTEGYNERILPQATVFQDTLQRLTIPNDGFLDDVPAKRNIYGADLVAMIFDVGSNPLFSGLAFTGPTDATMYSVTTVASTVSDFSFAREIGRNLGCLRDRGSQNACSAGGYNYGYRDPLGRVRDIMASPCQINQCDAIAAALPCTIVPRFSNIKTGFNDIPIGSPREDCARQINDVRLTVSQFRSSEAPVDSKRLSISRRTNVDFPLQVIVGNPGDQYKWTLESGDTNAFNILTDNGDTAIIRFSRKFSRLPGTYRVQVLVTRVITPLTTSGPFTGRFTVIVDVNVTSLGKCFDLIKGACKKFVGKTGLPNCVGKQSNFKCVMPPARGDYQNDLIKKLQKSF